jgi:uncharacterized protein YciI
MPQFIYRLQPARPAMLAEGPTERETLIVDEHFDHLKKLTAAGQVLLAGRTLTVDEGAFGIVVFEAESEAAARKLVAGDPAVRHGVMSAEHWPFRVALWSAKGPQGETGGA